MPKNRFVKSSNATSAGRCKSAFVSALALLLICFAGKSSRAQDEPIEPPFLPDQTPTTLADLLRDYKGLGLPLPRKGARLVYANDQEPRPAFGGHGRPENLELCFESEPRRKDQPGQFLIGLQITESTAPVQELRSPIDLRTAEALFDPIAHDPMRPIQWPPEFDRELILAIQCHAEGKNDLAEFLLRRCRSCTPIPLRKRLLIIAWNHWLDQLTLPGSDRLALAKYAKEMLAKNPEMVTATTRQLLDDLDCTLKPPQKRTARAEALIDQFMERCNEYRFPSHRIFPAANSSDESHKNDRKRNIASMDPCSQIAELGFEAIPFLIEHLEDRRLTRIRSTIHLAEGFPDGLTHVGDLARFLLSQWMDHPNQIPEGERDEGFFHDCWREISETGEERYLLKNILPNKPNSNSQPYSPYLNLLFQKYPDQLPSIYREILLNKPECQSGEVAEMIANGPFRKEDKCRWLMLGIGHARAEHRTSALAALAQADKKRFEAAWIKAMSVLLQGEVKWEESPFCTGVASLAGHADDPKVWELLVKVAKLAPVEYRARFISYQPFSYLENNTPCQIHFLLQFLDDDSVWEQRSAPRAKANEEQFVFVVKTEIRNLAAMELMGLLGCARTDDPSTPDEWKKLREKVRVLAERELKEN